MAGKKGMKGGGGARPGAGRKPKSAVKTGERDPVEFLLDVMQGLVDASPRQIQAATAAAQYLHAKPGTDGKKGARKGAAADAAGGKFAATPPPGPAKLSVVK